MDEKQIEESCKCGFHDEIGDSDEYSSNCGLGFYCCKECPALKEKED